MGFKGRRQPPPPEGHTELERAVAQLGLPSGVRALAELPDRVSELTSTFPARVAGAVAGLVPAAIVGEVMWLAEGFDPRSSRVKTHWRKSPPVVREAYRAIEVGLPLYVSMLSHSSPLVRASAARLLGWYGARTKDIRPALRAALKAETDPVATASMLLCLGLHAGYTGKHNDRLTIARYLESDDERVCRVAAIALGYVPARLSDRARAQLVDIAGGCEPWPELGWMEGAVDRLALGRVEHWLGVRPNVAIPALIPIFERNPTQRLARLLQKALFPGRGKIALGETSAAQRRWMAAVLDAPFVAAFMPVLHRLGLPRSEQEQRRVLALAGEGALDRTVTVAGTEGLVRDFLTSLVRTGQPEPAVVARAVLRRLDDADIVSAYVESFVFEHDPSISARGRLGKLLIDRLIKKDMVAAREALDALAVGYAEQLPTVRVCFEGDVVDLGPKLAWSVLGALGKARKGAEAPPPEQLDDFVRRLQASVSVTWPRPQVQRYLRALPVDRREALVIDLVGLAAVPDQFDVYIDELPRARADAVRAQFGITEDEVAESVS